MEIVLFAFCLGAGIAWTLCDRDMAEVWGVYGLWEAVSGYHKFQRIKNRLDNG